MNLKPLVSFIDLVDIGNSAIHLPPIVFATAVNILFLIRAEALI